MLILEHMTDNTLNPIDLLDKTKVYQFIKKKALNDKVKTIEDSSLYEDHEFEDYVLYEFKKTKPYQINRVGDVWVLSGAELEKVFKMTKFNSEESETRFSRKW